MYTTEPYYPLNKIITGKYTKGREFILDDYKQTEYVGLYHTLPNGDSWTGAEPNVNSKKILIKRFNESGDVKTYKQIKNISQSNYTAPVSFLPVPTELDYSTGFINRFFIQKRNEPYSTIQEIDVFQYNTINTRNRPGISGLMWNSVEIKWTIKGVYAEMLNLQEIAKAEQQNFPSLSTFLKNPLEFWK